MIRRKRIQFRGMNRQLVKGMGENSPLPFYFFVGSKTLLIFVIFIFAQSCPTNKPISKTFILAAQSLYQESLSINQHHTYQIELKGNEYLRLLVDSPRIDISLNLYNPRGDRLDIYKLMQGGYFPFSFIAEQAGTYRVDLLASEKETAGSYTIQVLEHRKSKSSDHLRISADSAFRKGELLRYGPG